MSTRTPNSAATAFPIFELVDQPGAGDSPETDLERISGDSELRALRFRVKHLEAQTSALKMQIQKLMASLAAALLKNIASTRCR